MPSDFENFKDAVGNLDAKAVQEEIDQLGEKAAELLDWKEELEKEKGNEAEIARLARLIEMYEQQMQNLDAQLQDRKKK